MIPMTVNQFPNMGYLQVKFSEADLKPIKLEIQKIIDSDFKIGQTFQYGLAGNINKEFKLDNCKEHVDYLIGGMCNQYGSEIFNYYKHIDLCTKDLPIVLDDVWVNFQKKHEFNPPHIHSGVFSFVIWIDIPYSIDDENNHPSSKLSNTPVAGQFAFNYTNALGRITTHYIPTDRKYNNTAVFFPAELSHQVFPFYTSDGYRISVSGNYKLQVKE